MKSKLLIAGLAALMAAPAADAIQYTETLNRGAIVMKSGKKAYLSWRSFTTDSSDMYFDIYRDGEKVNAAPITATTDYLDGDGDISKHYVIKAMQDNRVVEEFSPLQWASSQQITLNRPEGGVVPDNTTYTYTPNDCSVGDVDGDGEYELFVKWYPSNAQDNSNGGYTGNTIIDCYKLDGTMKWRVDLGINIRSGAHYTQFMVYDFDGDGRAEMICKTAPGSKDGTGAYVNAVATDDEIKAADNEKDWRTSAGRINGGQEWLTVFDGESGKAVHTIFYNPNRNTKLGGEAAGTFNWDDRSGRNDKGDYGNRGERYLACVAHLDGLDALPSAVMCRGYYTYSFLWAVDFDGEKLTTRWLHSSRSTTKYTVTDRDGNTETYTPGPATRGSGSATAYGNGNHNLTVGDVDGDGKDEIIWGACAIDDDGKLLYATGYGHGDAIHLGKMIPNREGLQVYDVHESAPYGWDLHDAATGEIIFSAEATKDTGRGCAADIDPDSEGYEMWAAYDAKPRSAVTGEVVNNASPSMNFRIYWDGDLQDELMDGSSIKKYKNRFMNALANLKGASCNGTKATPCLSADILGDWREEVILWDDKNPANIYINTTTKASEHRVPCLMQDHTYRMAICWQNVAYNQPPHLGYYLPDYVKTLGINDVKADNASGMLTIYSLAGLKLLQTTETATSALSQLEPGVYIVEYPDGHSEKVSVH